jgi:hypothetical protein
LSAGYFVVFIFPNSVGAQNTQMVMIFEPDEAVPLPYVFDMIRPADTIKQALIEFAFYKYYFYGFPHFAFSALVLLPLRWLGRIDEIPMVMVMLRQMVSVLPMLAAVLLLVYMQTGFRSYKSFVVFGLLLSVPALVTNNYWWHPDSLAILFAMLTLFFLNRDDLRLGRNFYLAAAMCGFSAGTKGIGFYFFLAVFVYLLIAGFTRKASWQKIIWSGALFIAAMALAYLLANPTLIYAGVRRRYFQVMSDQSQLLFNGYELVYARGLAAAWRLLSDNFGSWIFLLVSSGACIWGMFRGSKRLLNTLIFTWAVPITVMVIFLTHFKTQYLLPVALPLFSSAAVLLPDFRRESQRDRPPLAQSTGIRRSGAMMKVVQGCGVLVIVAQMVFFVIRDVQGYNASLHREEANPSISFYTQARAALAPLPFDDYSVYRDVGVYVPATEGWSAEGRFEMLDYAYFQEHPYDILLLEQQRILDYTNDDAQGIDLAQFQRSKQFYQDANAGQITGYKLVYRNPFGLVFVKDALFQKDFAQP